MVDLLAVSQGLVPGHKVVHKFGRNGSIDSGETEDIWGTGGEIQWQTEAAKIHINSDSANDTGIVSGSGAQIMSVWGLDGDFREKTENITLAGTVAVSSTNSYVWLERGRDRVWVWDTCEWSR